MKSFKLQKSNTQNDLKKGGIFALAISIPFFFFEAIIGLILIVLGIFLILASYSE